jgi:hypothetical protein|tara:strand:+ start:543 stop:878 length:336 start_codon:yes stop_codon:yes gene_type:complete
MKMKLKHAKQILDGLTSADFEKIRESAGVMNTFGNLENWARGRNPEYRTQLNFFRRENRELIRQVDKKNLDGSTQAFFQLTSSCVHCHQVIRDEARSDDASEASVKPARVR